jgi:hypothetical protein
LIFALSADQKVFLFLVSACVFCLNLFAVWGSCRSKKAIILKVPEKMMSKAGHAIIKQIKKQKTFDLEVCQEQQFFPYARVFLILLQPL